MSSNSALKKKISYLTNLNAQYQRSKVIQDTLLAISNIATEATSIDNFYRSVHIYLKALIPADNFFIATKDIATGLICLPFFADEKDSHPSDLYPQETISDLLESGITGYVFRQGKPLLCNNTEFETLINTGEIRDLGSTCHQWLGVPIKNQDRVSGVLVVQTYKEQHTYGELELELMVFISHHISGVMDRLLHQEQLEQAIEQRTKELSNAYDKLKAEVLERVKAEQLQKALFEIADLSSMSEHKAQFYASLHKIISKLIPAQNCFIALIESSKLLFPFYESMHYAVPPTSRPLKDGLTEYVLSTKKPTLLGVKEIQALIDERLIYHSTPELNKTSKIKQWMGIPLFIAGEVKGLLAVYSYENQYNYRQQDLELLIFVSQHIATAIERKQAADTFKINHELLEEKVFERTQALAATNQHLQTEIAHRKNIEAQLTYDAQHDSLTGLPNRNVLIDRLNQALKHTRRHGQDSFALLFIDLDRFKVINDTLGHMAGDQLLIETAKRLNACIRDNDTLARMGGDEFVIILDSIARESDAQEISERIIQSIAMPYWIANNQFTAGASIGIAFSHQNSQHTTETLLKHADKAMYQAKSKGKGCYVVFNEELGAMAQCNKEFEQEFTSAIDNQHFSIHFQPIIDLESKHVIAIEPYLEWQSQNGKHYTHNKIIDLAKKYQLAMHLDGVIFNYLNTHYPQLQRQYGAETQLHMRISSQHLKSKFSFRGLKNTIRTSQLDLSCLVVFFDEASLTKDLQSHINAFKVITDLGVEIGICEYGCGYSSLTHLSYLPISSLKLASSVSQNIQQSQQQKLALTYLLTAQALEYDVYACGVNSPVIQQQLVAIGYQFGQGHCCHFNSLNKLD
ncbi:diguanylate cyclase [Shewanella intestini]|uniref:Diguanylate cyclase n=2 Tax=Shewanellaceae TaxID=267890 RepID=A0ABS5I2E1_9GAMM|nr:diguanylate cyclase [Shewanella intestini]MRG36662.1 diguanylate cyclase [Shewanella sp. XMDDZSB0408]